MKLKVITDWNESSAYLMGAILGDGSVFRRSDGNWVIRLHVKDDDFANAFQTALKSMGLNPNKSTPGDGYIQVFAYSKTFAEWIKSIKLDEIERLELPLAKLVLKGIYDSEGNLTIRKRKHRPSPQISIRIVNSNIKLLKMCQSILRKIQVPSRINKHGLSCFVLSIASPYAVRVFLEEINSNIHRKSLLYFQEKLQQHLKFSYVLHLDHDYPIPEQWWTVWRETTMRTLGRLNLFIDRIITKPSPSGKGGVHKWIHLLSPRMLYDEQINMLQWLLGDCPTRVWINQLRIKRGLRKFWNKLFVRHIWRRPLPKRCQRCKLREILNEMREIYGERGENK